jgi:hypothetical protein
MISALAGLSALGGSLTLAKAGVLRPVVGAPAASDPIERVGGPADEISAAPTAGETSNDAQPGADAVSAASGVVDRVELSPEGLARSREAAEERPGARGVRSDEQLSDEEQQEVTELKRRDAEVRAHERAHQSGGGQYAGSPSYAYQTGPDGKRYAVGGEVSVDVSPVAGDPQATIVKMEQIRRAALAPAQPSAQDRRVAAKAAQVEQEARAELVEQRRGEGTPDEASAASGAPGWATNSSGIAAYAVGGALDSPRLDVMA